MTRIGFIGLGVMGTPMAGHLAAAGYPLTVHDIDTGATARFAADHPAATAGRRRRRRSACGRRRHDAPRRRTGAAGRARAGRARRFDGGRLAAHRLLVGPAVADAGTAAGLASAGSRWSTPRSPAPSGGRAGRARVHGRGGGRTMWARRPVLDVLGRAVFHVGPLGSGHIMKCINNTITAMTLLATVEGLVLGTRAGLDPAAINAVLNESTGGSSITRTTSSGASFADVRRPVQARADAQGRPHRDPARSGPRARPPLCRPGRDDVRGRQRPRRAGEERERARALGRARERCRDRARWPHSLADWSRERSAPEPAGVRQPGDELCPAAGSRRKPGELPAGPEWGARRAAPDAAQPPLLGGDPDRLAAVVGDESPGVVERVRIG